ncbi:MAG: tyrosine-type recombinase/integrase [Propionibacteriales bacterium]|nr:tyrosine-type recombinase/integrase [Propionibacteriales bacterium]
MSVQRYERNGKVRYRARVKSHGREVATKVFDRKADAVAWEQDQTRRLRLGEWTDPKRGRVPLSAVAADWMASRSSVKRKTQENERMVWRVHISPRFGNSPVASITTAQVATWVGGLVASGLAPSTAARYLQVLRSVVEYAVADGRIRINPAADVKPPTKGSVRREGQYLTRQELHDLAEACKGLYAELVLVLGLAGLRWGELAGLQVGDRVSVPGPGLRLQRAMLASTSDAALFIDTLKGKRARTVPLVDELVPILDRWAEGKASHDWVFPAPRGGPLSERNWKRSVGWSAAVTSIGRKKFRVHDLRHTCASLWLAAGADPKVVQRILGHASAAMTMDLYGHLVDHNLWEAAKRLGGTTGAQNDDEDDEGSAGELAIVP